MNLLLDTHLLLWAAFRPDRLSRDAAAMIADPGNRLWFSAASIWEVAIKRALDRPDFRVDPGVLQAGLLANDYAELPIAGRHYLGVSGLPALHADPFDRILIAQALAEGMMLLTANARIAAYPGCLKHSFTNFTYPQARRYQLSPGAC